MSNLFPRIASAPSDSTPELEIGIRLTQECRALAERFPTARERTFLNALMSIAANVAMEHGVTQSQFERYARAVYQKVSASKYAAAGDA